MFPHHTSKFKFNRLKLQSFCWYQGKFHFSSTPNKDKSNTKLAQDIFDWAKRGLFVKSIFGFVALFTTGLLGNAFYLEYERARRKKLFRSTIENGSFPAVDETELVSRPEVEKMLVDVLSPPKDFFYVLVTGEHGTGKTTAIRLACNKVKKGVIYVEVPNEANQFPNELAKALNLDYSPLIGLRSFITKKILGMEEPQQSENRSTKITYDLQEAAREYSKKYKRPLVLVIDNINILAKKSPETLEVLQMYAKSWSDEGLIRVVFVASEGSAPQFLQRNSSWSRAARPIEVGDLTEAQSIEFLKKRGVNENIAKDIYSVTGGRIRLLKKCELWMSFEEMRRYIFEEIEGDFESSGILDGTKPWHEPGMLLMNTILSSKDGRIENSELRALIPSQEIRDKLLQAQVFSFHPSSRTITFQSRAAENYAKFLREKAKKEAEEKAKKRFWFF